MADRGKSAIIVGASSGIGEALARQLHGENWSLGLMARREERLSEIAADLKNRTVIGYVDVSKDDCSARFNAMVEALGIVDLVIISAGIGHLNSQHDMLLDQETLAVNVSGFAAIAQAAFCHFERTRTGHLVAITSIASLRGSAAGTAYAASKAFQSVYLDGLRDFARLKRLSVAVTELQPGFVDTDMLKQISLCRLLRDVYSSLIPQLPLNR